MRFSRLSVAVAALLLACFCATAPAGAATASTVGIGPAPQLPTGATLAGAVAPQRPLHLLVALEPRDPAALEAFATEVATPGSPVYGAYLSVPEFASRFGATPAQVATVRTALGARGLQVGTPGANQLSLPVTATAAEAEAAFGTAIDRIQTTSGRVAYANLSAPRVPVAAAPFVAGVLGLDDLTVSHHQTASPVAAAATPDGPVSGAAPTTSVLAGGAQPCSEALEAQQNDGGYTANQVAAAYSLSGYYAAGDLGAGQTIAVLELEPFGEADVAAYQACYGTATEVTAVDVEGGPGPYEAGEDGESALDIEQLIGLAPAAKILVYQAPNSDEIEILSAWIEADLAKVMSSSWGICEKETSLSEMTAVDTLLQEAAAQGQSFFVASGDAGSTDCYEQKVDHDKSLQVDFPGTDPFATSVGGTQMDQPTTPPVQYLWNDGVAEGAGGGGVSKHFPMPTYQLDAAPALDVLGPVANGANCGSPGYCRQVPDVSANTAPRTGYVVHTEEEWQVEGGTSAAAPLWAAFAALAEASPACAGNPIGFANPALYSIAGSAYSANFDDVTASRPGGPPTTNLFNSSEPYAAGPGYDMATGIGTPIGTSLGDSLCGAPRAVISPSSPSSGPGGNPSPKNKSTPSPAPAHLVHAALSGAAKGSAKLRLTVAARVGGDLSVLTVSLPPGLLAAERPRALTAGIVVRDGHGGRRRVAAHATAHKIRVRLASPAAVARLTLSFPALITTPKLAAKVRAGRVHRLGLVVTARETGGAGARFPATLKL